jgi:hypothetical protein
MKQFRKLVVFLIFFESLVNLSGQTIRLAKSIDTVTQSSVAILAIDSAGNYVLMGSGALINPQVVLTAGHENFKLIRQIWGKNCSETGYISVGNNSFKSDRRIPFNWIKNVETHPDLVDKGIFDYPSNFTLIADIGLIFLNQPVLEVTPLALPDTNLISRLNEDDHLLGAGYGITKILTSFVLDSIQKTIKTIDGYRRSWKPSKILIINDLWFKAGCDPETNRPYIGIGDSGSPLLLNNSTVVGVWDNGEVSCPGFICGTRVDNPKILKWINDCISYRLGTKIK